MKTRIKVSLIVIALTLLAVVVLVLRSRPDEFDEPLEASVSETSQGPSFDVRVVPPRAGLPLAGILPDALVRKFDGTPSELRFDHTSPGAQMVHVENNRVEFIADGGWDLWIVADGEGSVTPETHLVFTFGLGGNRVTLDCRPANPAKGRLQTITRPGSDKLSGRFVVELAICKNTDSGKTTDWPPAPLTVSGRFAGLGNPSLAPKRNLN